MEPINRRTFITRSGAAVAAAGVAAIVPTQLAGAATTPKAGAAELIDGEIVIDGNVESADPIIAHVRDANAGDIAIFSGDREVLLHDRALAQKIARAAGRK